MNPEIQSQKTRALCSLAPVIPVIVIKNAERAAGLARALVSGGLPVLEITLRSDAALDAIRAMSGVSGGHVGAGTVLTPDDAKRAKDAATTSQSTIPSPSGTNCQSGPAAATSLRWPCTAWGSTQARPSGRRAAPS